MKPNTDVEQVNDFEQSMSDLAEASGLTHDGSDDARLFQDSETIWVYVHLMTRAEYKKMTAEINKAVIKRRHYIVYAWNDVSGYEYWKKDSESGSPNYINVTASIKIKDPSKVDAEALKRDVESLYSRLCHFNNSDEYFNAEMDKRERSI